MSEPVSPMVPLGEALATVAAAARPLAPRRVSIAQADGLVLAEDVVARRTQPPHAVSAMDGYAVSGIPQAGDRLKVIGEAAAGAPRSSLPRLNPGEALRIFTGAFVPEGASAVIIQEDVIEEGTIGEDGTREAAFIRVGDHPGASTHIRPKGGDFSAGSILVPAGTQLSPDRIALVAAGDYASVSVHPRPRVLILMNGDELALPETAAAEDAIIASNGYALAALVARLGGDVVDTLLLRDDLSQLKDTCERPDADLVVTIGGASVGDYDLVRPALEAAGFLLTVPKVALRPGKPTLFGIAPGPRYALGLPGNPVSSYVSGLLFLRPLLNRLLGRPLDPILPLIDGHLSADLTANGPRAHFMRAMRTEDGGYAPTSSQDSSLLSILGAADALLYRPPYAAAASRGAPCQVLPLPR